MNSYELSRAFFNWSFENPEKIKPNHVAIFFFAMEHCNRLGGKDKFGFPTSMVKDAIGIKDYSTYIKALNDLIAWGFIVLVEKSTNQYSSNIIALGKFPKAHPKAHPKALDKAFIKHASKQPQSTPQSIPSIDKQGTIEQGTIKEQEQNNIPTLQEFLEYCKTIKGINYPTLIFSLTAKYNSWVADGWKDGNGKPIKVWKTKIVNVIPHLKPMQEEVSTARPYGAKDYGK